MKVKAIYLVDLSAIIREVNPTVLRFSVKYGVDSVSDLTNLFVSRVIVKMTDVYKEVHSAFVVFYISREHEEELRAARDLINYRRFFTMLKKVRFPMISSNLPYSLFAEALKGNSPEYDEAVQNHHSFAELAPRLSAYVRKMKFHKIDDELIADEREMMARLTSL